MNYETWGAQYMNEAQRIDNRVKELRSSGAEPERVAQLCQIRSELRSVGRELAGRGLRYGA